MKKKCLFLLALICLLSCIINITPQGVKADSGFDSSYSSGSSSSGSSWSSSSYSSGSSSSYHRYGSSNYNDSDFVAMLPIIVFIVIMIIIAIRNQNKTTYTPFKLDHSKEVPDEKVKEFIEDFDKKTFLNDRFNDYKKVQEDWMNFNYDSLRENLTDELYNQYEMQLDTLKAKNQKNVMTNINYHDSMITDINKENGLITVTMEMLVSQIDYLESDGKAVRGNKNTPMNMHYELKFVLTNININTCPNCGAKLNASASNKCEYCGSVVSKVGNKAVLSKKENLRQK